MEKWKFIVLELVSCRNTDNQGLKIMVEYSDEYLEVLTAVQEGDLELVKEAISERLVSVNALDRDGCSFLHWAAINNRVAIAQYLIENGLVHTGAGGVLGESPLQWAVRKKYYVMMDLIFQRAHCNLSHQANNGSDALHLACKLGDINAAFLLLNWGANPDSTDKQGDTPLLWLLKNRSGMVTNELVRLLLRFGASAVASNPQDGNSALHVLIGLNKTDASISFLIYKAAGAVARTVTNSAGLTPYTLAVSTNNRRMARFLFDALIFDTLPYWAPGIGGLILVVAIFQLIKVFGILYGLIYWFILYVAIAWSLLEWQLVDYRCRSVVGAFIGFVIALIASYRDHIAPQVHMHLNIFISLTTLCFLCVAYKFNRTNPSTTTNNTKTAKRSALAAQIIASAPAEGTDDEVEQLNSRLLEDDSNNNTKNHNISSANCNLSPKFIKDKFTGQLRRVGSTQCDDDDAGGNSSNNNRNDKYGQQQQKVQSLLLYQGRSLGPRMCGSCLADKRSCVQPHTSQVVLPSSTIIDFILGGKARGKATTNGSTDVSSATSSLLSQPRNKSRDSVISLAIHCGHCNACVIDQDHHCVYLGNCVGKGNRRLYWLFLLFGCLSCLLYFISSKYIHQYVTCRDDAALYSGNFLSNTLCLELCALSRQPAFYFLSWLNAATGFYFLCLLQVQITCVARETTFLNVIKKRYEAQAPPFRRRIKNILTFLYSGLYNVTYPKQSRITELIDEEDKTRGAAVDSNQPPHINDDGGGAAAIEYEKAMKLLNSIDTKLHLTANDDVAAIEATGLLRKSHLLVETSSSAAAGTTYAAPLDATTTSSSEKKRSAAEHKHKCNDKQCSEEEAEESDYDIEFVESSQNNYLEYYYQDNDDDDDTYDDGSGKAPLLSTRSSQQQQHQQRKTSSTAVSHNKKECCKHHNNNTAAGSSTSTITTAIRADERV